MTATLSEPSLGHDHVWWLENVDFDELVGQVSQFSCTCGAVWFR
jgi:hypothetical protein